MSSAPRVGPLEPPYDPEVDAALRRWMPPGTEDIEPLTLFRTLMVHPDLASRMRPLGAGLLGRGALSPREREIVVHRTSVRSGATYEWGVHAVAFAPAVGLSEAQVDATATGDADDPAWTELRDRLLIRFADEMAATAMVSDALWAELAAEWSAPELLELVVLAGWYRLIAGVVNALGVEDEPWARRLPPS